MVEATERIGEVLDAVIAHVETCEWTRRRARPPSPSIEALGMKSARSMPAVYAAVEGVHQGLPLFDSIYLLGRDARPLARGCGRAPGPALD